MFHCTLVLQNEDKWLQHITEVIKSQGTKSEAELLKEIFTFDFKFDTILEDYSSSFAKKDNP